jgi:exopolyphosphatase/guanosine-5'-triphosphate,3'-diphosphate pyrophosphatase
MLSGASAAGFAGSRPLAVASIPLGCLQLQQQQQQLQQSQDTAQAILTAHRSAVDSVVHALQQHHQQQQPLTVVATGGTVTTLAALHLGLKEYDSHAVHGSELRRSDVAALAQALQQQQAQERPAWVSDARVETLLPGCCALLALLDVLLGGGGGGGVEQRVTVSDCDLLDGVLVAQLEVAAAAREEG